MKKLLQFNPRNLDPELQEKFCNDIISMAKNGIFTAFVALFSAFPTYFVETSISYVGFLLYFITALLFSIFCYRIGYVWLQDLRNDVQVPRDQESS